MYTPSFCLSPADMGLLLPEMLSRGTNVSDAFQEQATNVKEGGESDQCPGELIEVRLDDEFKGSAHLPSLGMVVDPRPREA